VAAGERAHRADVLGHQGVVALELAPRRDHDLEAVAALAQVEHVVADELVADADAARAGDAALGVVDDGVAEGHGLGLVHRLVEHALGRVLLGEVVVLEPALAGLVADGAVDRVVEQEKLLHVRPGVLDEVGVLRAHHHALRGHLLAGGLELGLAVDDVVALGGVPLEYVEHHRALPGAGLDLDEAHAAVGRDGETRVPAVVRDLDPLTVGRLDDGLALLEGDLDVIKLESRHRSTL